MKHFLICLSLFTATFLVSACGKTEFSAVDSTSLKAGEVDEGKNLDMDKENGVAPGDDASIADAHSCGEKKVLICHVPPGNAAAAHTICIGRPALQAHMNLHEAAGGEKDSLGDCADRVPLPAEE